MNYTENYHLPQWDEHDRIMRSDFNQMCADIESGLTRSRDTGETLGARTMDWFGRMAYNHYCAVQNMEPFPYQIGVFHQNPAKNISGITGTRLWSGVPFAGKSSVTLTHEVLLQGFKKLTPLHVVKGNLAESTPFTASFKVPSSGHLRQISLYGSYSDNTPNKTANFQLTLKNMETGAVEQSLILDFKQSGGTGVAIDNRVDAPLDFLGNVEYLLTVRPLDAVYNLEGGVTFNQYTYVDTCANEGIVSASHTFQEQEGGRGGLLLLRCTIAGAGGTLTMLWDGVERQPNATRWVQARDGRIIQELVYYRGDRIPANSTQSLRFVCKEGGSFVFYDWGAMLL